MSLRKYTLIALVVFAVLGVIDFIDTFVLIRQSDGHVYESNPLAATWLKDFGWKGLAVFKAITILIVGAIVLLLLKRSPRSAAAVATFACLCLFAVTIYSRNLILAMSQENLGS